VDENHPFLLVKINQNQIDLFFNSGNQPELNALFKGKLLVPFPADREVIRAGKSIICG